MKIEFQKTPTTTAENGINPGKSVTRVSRLANRASIFSVQRLSTIALGVVLLISAPLLFAQHGSMSGGVPVGMGGAAGASVAHIGGGVPHGVPGGVPNGPHRPGQPGLVGGFHHHHGFRNNGFGNSVFLGSPYWGYWDDDEQVVYEQPPEQPQQAPVQQQQMMAAPSRPPAEPLVIEWQGDRYVRSGGNVPGAPNQGVAPRDYSEAPRAKAASQAAQPLPPAILAFRNGTRQEVNSYTIVGKTLYASGDYWTQGYWTKTIQLADLDLPETIRLNQQRGVPFKLPSAPNDIVTRP